MFASLKSYFSENTSESQEQLSSKMASESCEQSSSKEEISKDDDSFVTISESREQSPASKSREKSPSTKETLKNEDLSTKVTGNIMQFISRLRGVNIINEKISIAEKSNVSSVPIDVEDLKEIGKELTFLTKGVTELAIALEDINKTTKEVKSWVQNRTDEISEEKL
ncbi:4857_t:CDS:2, partial [Scutellospora calospora]